MTKSPQQIRNEVEKGCGGSLRGGKITKRGYKYYCGNNLKRTNKVAYCMRCQAKLSILTEYDKSIKEIIKDVFDNEIFKDKRNLVSRDGDELWIKLRKELLGEEQK